jgi:general nucleoside transport system permease protein
VKGSWSWRHAVLTLGAFLVVAAAIQASGVPGADLTTGFLRVVTTGGGWRNVLAKTTPLLLGGLAVYAALRAGLFNIGAEGQMVMGGLASAAVYLALPSPLGLFLGLIAGCAAGGLWAFPAGWIKAYRGGHEVISTIMLNWIGRFLSVYIVTGVLADPTDPSATTREIPPAALLPNVLELGAFRVNASLIIALVAMIAVTVWLTRTVSGYEVEAVGAAPKAAEAGGVLVKKVTVQAMTISGALCGLAGAMLVAGVDRRFYPDLAGGAGFDSLGVALLAVGSPLLTLPAALLFAFIDVSTSGLSLAGLPKGLSSLLLGLVILVFAAYRFQRRKG